MKFRTEIHLKNSEEKIEVEDKIFSMGSCFSYEMSELLRSGQLQTLNNPFGTIFNPYSIQHAISKIHGAVSYEEEDLIVYDNQVISLDHHSSFTSQFPHQTLEKINSHIEEANLFLQDTNWVIITYGSSIIHEFLPKKKLVANCHKIPAKYFEKRFLSHSEITESITKTIEDLNDICKENVQILLTVSPVRHTKDGMVENSLSKANLISAIHQVLPNFENCHYLPVYEILMDDLRDYRFYEEDLIHPNSQAIHYIWEKFAGAYFDENTLEFITENFKISKSLDHRPSDQNHPKYREFLENLKGRIALQQTKVKHKIFETATI